MRKEAATRELPPIRQSANVIRIERLVGARDINHGRWRCGSFTFYVVGEPRLDQAEHVIDLALLISRARVPEVTEVRSNGVAGHDRLEGEKHSLGFR